MVRHVGRHDDERADDHQFRRGRRNGQRREAELHHVPRDSVRRVDGSRIRNLGEEPGRRHVGLRREQGHDPPAVFRFDRDEPDAHLQPERHDVRGDRQRSGALGRGLDSVPHQTLHRPEHGLDVHDRCVDFPFWLQRRLLHRHQDPHRLFEVTREDGAVRSHGLEGPAGRQDRHDSLRRAADLLRGRRFDLPIPDDLRLADLRSVRRGFSLRARGDGSDELLRHERVQRQRRVGVPVEQQPAADGDDPARLPELHPVYRLDALDDFGAEELHAERGELHPPGAASRERRLRQFGEFEPRPLGRARLLSDLRSDQDEHRRDGPLEQPDLRLRQARRWRLPDR